MDPRKWRRLAAMKKARISPRLSHFRGSLMVRAPSPACVAGRSESRVRLVGPAGAGFRSRCSARIQIPIANGRPRASARSSARRDVSSVLHDRGVPSAEQGEQNEEYQHGDCENSPDPAREAPGRSLRCRDDVSPGSGRGCVRRRRGRCGGLRGLRAGVRSPRRRRRGLSVGRDGEEAQCRPRQSGHPSKACVVHCSSQWNGSLSPTHPGRTHATKTENPETVELPWY
jgi:hypothetical protein